MVWPYVAAGVVSPGPIPAATWAIMERVLVSPPSAYGLQPWVFIMVRDPQLRARLLCPAGEPAPVADCSHFVVFARNTLMSEADMERFVNRATDGHAAPHGAFRGYASARLSSGASGAHKLTVEEWTARQAYVALGDLLIAAELLGVPARPMDALNPARYDEVLGLVGKGYATVCACALGYVVSADSDWSNEAAKSLSGTAGGPG
jgi:nitroreductase